ncbi:DUF4186 domain-containing protein [Sphingomonas agri]|uniref:DUF4186 domain-containing protein n=1 Tax=Sphingomonas agri TaxID=1813878 RepID=UPI00311F3D0E
MRRGEAPMRDLDTVFKKLALSAFRSRFALGDKDRAYLEGRGARVIRDHARDLIARRLAPARPYKDGKQTPWRGHPVFVAQHATGTCCRSCLAKWHGIEAGRLLTGEEQEHVVDAIMRWLADSPR